MEELGLIETCATSPMPGNTFEYGYQCTEDLLNQNPDLDAIMAAVDIQGMAAIRALKDRKIRVPEQIRLVSLTGHSIGGLLETTMTSLEIPAHEMGEKRHAWLSMNLRHLPVRNPACSIWYFPHRWRKGIAAKLDDPSRNTENHLLGVIFLLASNIKYLKIRGCAFRDSIPGQKD